MSLPSDFDWVGYYINNPNIATNRCSHTRAVDHWKEKGCQQNLRYHQTRRFDWKAYITRYPDLPAHKINTEDTALLHYIKYGRLEGRNPFSEDEITDTVESKIPLVSEQSLDANVSLISREIISIPKVLSTSFSFPIPEQLTSNDNVRILMLGSFTDDNVKIYIERFAKQFVDYSFIIMSAEDNGRILSINYQTQNYKSEILADYTCIRRLIKDYDIKGIHMIELMNFDLNNLSNTMKDIETPYIITPFNWVYQKELFLRAKEIILPSQSSFEKYKSTYPNLKMTLIPPEKISYGESTSRKILQIGVDARFLNEGIVNRFLDNIRKRKLSLSIITDLNISDVIWIPIISTQCYDYMIGSIQCENKLYVTARTPLSSELSSKYARSYLYRPDATVTEIVDIFVLLTNVNTLQDHSTKRISMINSHYHTVYKRHFPKPISLLYQLDNVVKSRFFVISGGKTGSSSLVASFDQSIHLHSCLYIEYAYPYLIDIYLSDLYDYATKMYVDPSKNEKVVLLSAVRDPVSRSISSFFQNIECHLEMTQDEILLTPTSNLISIFNKRFFTDIEDYYPFWDPDEPLLNGYAGRDLLQTPFDHQKKRLIFEDEKYRILILRFEDIKEWDQIIRSTLPTIDLVTYSFKSDNLSETKWYYNLYRRFLAEYSVPRDLLDTKFNNPYHIQVLSHFYSPNEIMSMKQKWYTKATEERSDSRHISDTP